MPAASTGFSSPLSAASAASLLMAASRAETQEVKLGPGSLRVGRRGDAVENKSAQGLRIFLSSTGSFRSVALENR